MTSGKILLIPLLLLNSFLFGQSVDMLHLKDQKYFTEQSLFTYKPVVTISYQVYFDIPEMHDEEYRQSISFTLKNMSDLKPGTEYDLQKDSSIINPHYSLTGAWQIEGAGSYSGNIKVLSITEKEIALYLNFTVEGKQKYIYKGSRTFLKTEKISCILAAFGHIDFFFVTHNFL